MPKSSHGPISLTDAIERMESAGQNKVHDFKNHMEKEYEDLKQVLENIKPYLEDLKSKVETEAKAAKNQVETKVKENPWTALGIMAVFSFFIGWLIGHSKK